MTMFFPSTYPSSRSRWRNASTRAEKKDAEGRDQNSYPGNSRRLLRLGGEAGSKEQGSKEQETLSAQSHALRAKR